jgi:hypothetical protein
VNNNGAGTGAAVSVSLDIDGGFAYIPGLHRSFQGDSTTLTADDLARLRALLAKADFFNRSAEPAASAPGAADLRTYTVTVTEGGQSHTIHVTEPIQDPEIRALVDQLVSWQRRTG